MMKRLHWYNNPKIIIPAITAAIAFLGLIIAYFTIVKPVPAFVVSIDSLEGSVRQGGIIQRTVTVEDLNDYEKYTVSLSAGSKTDQLPEGMVWDFKPPTGGPKPNYTSNLVISVGNEVQTGKYEIIVKGMGSTGYESICVFTLNVTSSDIAETETISSTTTSEPAATVSEAATTASEVTTTVSESTASTSKPQTTTAKQTTERESTQGAFADLSTQTPLGAVITSPQTNGTVSYKVDVKCKVDGQIPKGAKAMLLVKDPLGQYWAWGPPGDNTFKDVLIGNSDDSGKEFEIILLITSEDIKTNTAYKSVPDSHYRSSIKVKRGPAVKAAITSPGNNDTVDTKIDIGYKLEEQMPQGAKAVLLVKDPTGQYWAWGPPEGNTFKDVFIGNNDDGGKEFEIILLITGEDIKKNVAYKSIPNGYNRSSINVKRK